MATPRQRIEDVGCAKAADKIAAEAAKLAK